MIPTACSPAIAVLPETGVMGGYMYSAGFGAGDAWFMTPLFDADSGAPLALLDGTSMNPFKTGAAGAVAVDESLTASVRAVDSSTAAVAGADVVITATTASEPVFDGDELEPGTHVTAMGQYSPAKRELDTTTIEQATYVPDLRERATLDAGSFIHALEAGAITDDHVHAELGEIVAGNEPGRTSDDEITVFDSGGTGIETVAVASLLYDRALEAGRGTEIEFAPASEALMGD
ncbi:ornithine cyclodeaminase [Natrinema limicola JCM 13563]|uniref:Ornithine cyclodeaminase n=1 Tax=Natrinema limicola JCM 13563 TaxID=1230457 RepID=M0CHM1_9EURY|nr:ornithine cyclodeaminase [Natrinema limicola JCM 13563]